MPKKPISSKDTSRNLAIEKNSQVRHQAVADSTWRFPPAKPGKKRNPSEFLVVCWRLLFLFLFILVGINWIYPSCHPASVFSSCSVTWIDLAKLLSLQSFFQAMVWNQKKMGCSEARGGQHGKIVKRLGSIWKGAKGTWSNGSICIIKMNSHIHIFMCIYIYVNIQHIHIFKILNYICINIHAVHTSKSKLCFNRTWNIRISCHMKFACKPIWTVYWKGCTARIMKQGKKNFISLWLSPRLQVWPSG